MANCIGFNYIEQIVKKNLLLLLLIFGAVAIAACREESPRPREQGPAPDFTLPSVSGDNIRLNDLRGKVVLLNFWATWCPPCREEIPSLVELNASMKGKPFQMWTVTNDNMETVLAFFSKRGVTLPTLLDAGSVTRSYGITGFPETFIVDKRGIITKKVVGPLDWSDSSVIQYLESLAKQ